MDLFVNAIVILTDINIKTQCYTWSEVYRLECWNGVTEWNFGVHLLSEVFVMKFELG